MERIICLTEDAYKKIVSEHTGDFFKERGFYQVPKLTESKIIEKAKGYVIDREDKKFRIISPILTDGVVTDISVVTSITADSIVWDRG